jgi:hypothetical protein
MVRKYKATNFFASLPLSLLIILFASTGFPGYATSHIGSGPFTTKSMAPHVPQEILSLIVQHVVKEDDGHKLTPYTLVNKSWQAAFERKIYGSVVVLSPSDVSTIMVSRGERRGKRGLSFARLDDITGGPQYWRQMRRTYIQRILYRVNVPYWINPCREMCRSTYDSDNAWRRQNNQAFSQGVRSLFDYLSTWTDQDIALDIALQSDMGYFVKDRDFGDDEVFTYDDVNSIHNEPGTSYVQTEFDTLVPPYGAHLLPELHLPRARCVVSLNFPIIDLELSNTWSENSVSLPAVLRIASACGSLRRMKLDGTLQRVHIYGVPYTTPEIWNRERDATAAALTLLPRTIQHIEFLGNEMWIDYLESTGRNLSHHKQDSLSTALRDISSQLKTLHIKDEVVFPELFSLEAPEGLLDIHWPQLEVLHLTEIQCCWTLFCPSHRYADRFSFENTPCKRYIEDMYTRFGYAAQRMPRLKDAIVEVRDSTLRLGFRDSQWMISFKVRDKVTYGPSLRVLEAWKLARGDLNFRTGLDEDGCDVGYWEATYTSWPPL